MKQTVKLYIYQFEGEKVMVGIEEAEKFENFVVISVNGSIYPQEYLEGLYTEAVNSFPDKRVIMLDKNLDIAFYGVKEVPEIGAADASRLVDL